MTSFDVDFLQITKYCGCRRLHLQRMQFHLFNWSHVTHAFVKCVVTLNFKSVERMERKKMVKLWAKCQKHFLSDRKLAATLYNGCVRANVQCFSFSRSFCV